MATGRAGSAASTVWSRLQMAYLTVGDEEARDLMTELTE